MAVVTGLTDEQKQDLTSYVNNAMGTWPGFMENLEEISDLYERRKLEQGKSAKDLLWEVYAEVTHHYQLKH